MIDGNIIGNKVFNEFQDLVRKLGQRTPLANDQPSAVNPENSDTRYSGERWRYAQEFSKEVIWDWNISSDRIYYSGKWIEIFGCGEPETVENFEDWCVRIHPNDLDQVLISLTNHLKGETSLYHSEYRLRCKEGAYIWVLTEGKIVSYTIEGDPIRLVGIHRDISRSRNMELALGERIKELNCHNQMSEIISIPNVTTSEVIRQIVQVIPESCQFPEIAQALVSVNNQIFTTSGYQKSPLSLRFEIKANEKVIGEVVVCYPDGLKLDAEQIFLPEESLLLYSIAQRIGNFVDKREKELILRDNDIKYRDIIENINDVVFETDKHGFITFISTPVFKIFGYTAEEITGKNFIHFVGENGQLLLKRLYELSDKVELKNEYQICTKTGESRWIRLSSRALFSEGNFKGGAGTIVDITDRKLAEEKIEKLNRLYSVISHVSQAIIHMRDKQVLMDEVCRIAIEFGKFRMAWIGLIDEETKIVIPVAKSGFEEGYLSLIKQISVSDIPEGRGPTGSAIRKGDHFVCDNFETNPEVTPWRTLALERNYRSSMALPLKQSGKIIGAFTLYASQPYFFDQEEIDLLDEFVNEISFAFETIENENVRQKAEEQLRKLSRAVEQSPVSIVITNLEGSIEYANPKESATTGYTLDDLIGKNSRLLKSGETSDIEYQKLWEDITSGKEWHGIFHNQRRNGKLYWESATISPIIDNQGKITHFLAIKEDITEEKLAEQELRQSEERYKVLFENNHTIMMLIDPETGDIKNANPAACNYYGWSVSELCTKKIWEINLLKPDESKIHMQQSLNLKRNQFYFKHKLRNGELRDVEVFSNPVQIGESKLLFVIINDITKRKLAEQEILKFRTIADQANYGSAITSLDGHLLYINAAFAHMHGFEPSELSDKELSIFHNEAQLPEVTKLLDQLKTRGSFSAQELWHTRKDGSVFPTLMNASLIFDTANVPQFLSATAIDITKLKQKEEALLRSEEDLNNAQKLANLGSWEHNLVTGKLTGSKNYSRMLGLNYETEKGDLYNYFISIILPDDLKVIHFLQNHHYVENEMQVVEIRILLPGNGIRWLQNNVIPIFEKDRLIALRGVNIDITEKKKMVEDLIYAKEQAEESDRLKTSFLNNISHEIRTPFNGILGFLSMLQYDDLAANERAEYFDLINQSADRLMNTINDIVEISQIQAGQVDPSFIETNIRSIIEDQIARFRPEAEQKGLQFVIHIEESPIYSNFLTDRRMLNTILFHLIGNAFKFTREGFVDLTVCATKTTLEFCIKDSGIGISHDKQQMIFSHFIQADYTNTRKFEGSGLGLAITKAYIEMLNGKLWLESEEGKGSAFYFSLPDFSKHNQDTGEASEKRVVESRAKDLKILIAEDDERSALFLSILVKPFAKEILKVSSGDEAVKTCRENPDLDLILMDIRMPILDGYEATSQIREFNSRVVIIAQTAYALTGDYEKSAQAGCNDYISKPIQIDKLQALIKKYFNM